MTTNVFIENDQLIVEPVGIDKVWTVHQKLVFPMSNVMHAEIEPDILKQPKELKFYGLATFNQWRGVFIKNGIKKFYNVSRHDQPVVIQLRNEKYAQLILGVDNPQQLVKKINEDLK